MNIPQTSEFLNRCKEAYCLVQGYLNDSIPNEAVRLNQNYTFNPKVNNRVKDNIQQSMEILKSTVETHSLQELAISYNGGKDCLVMLILLLAAIHLVYGDKHDKGEELSQFKLESIYINSEECFPEVLDFIEDSTKHYSLNPIIIKNTLKEGFQFYLDLHPNVTTIIVGIRHSDPFGDQLSPEQMTDHNWPRFLRIHPILHWNYNEVWDFIISCDLKYCCMYDKGYTSLGGINSTVPNPYLRNQDGSYLPAYKLTKDSDDKERLGRYKVNS